MQHSLHHDLRSKKHRGRSGSSAGRPYSKWNRDVHNFPIAVDRAQANPLRFPHAPPSSSATSPNTHRNIEAAFSNFFAGGRSQWCGSGHETKQRLSNPNFRQRKHKRRRYNAHIPLYTFSQYHDEPFYLEWWSGTRPEKRQESKKRKRKNQRDERAHTERERERERERETERGWEGEVTLLCKGD